ncbi:MAG TPA: hypothetical protein VIV11_26560 [Kofleriaceae bacterium]
MFDWHASRERAIAVGLAAAFAMLVIEGVFVADWSDWSFVSDRAGPDIPDESIGLWGIAGCSLFGACDVAGWAQRSQPFASIILWLSAAFSVGVVISVAQVFRGRRTARYSKWLALVMLVASFVCVLGSAAVHMGGGKHGANVELAVGPSLVFVAHVLGFLLIVLFGAREARSEPVPLANVPAARASRRA